MAIEIQRPYYPQNNGTLTVSSPDYWREFYKISALSNNINYPLVTLCDGLRSNNGSQAVDYGAGIGQDTQWLLDRNYIVISVRPEWEAFLEEGNNSFLTGRNIFIYSPLETFQFPPEVSLINAKFSLSFLPNHYILIIQKIYESLKIGGIFCGVVYGENDMIAKKYDLKTFSKTEITLLFRGFLMVYLDEEEDVYIDRFNDLIYKTHLIYLIAKRSR